MANHRSAEKRTRQNEKRNAINRSNRSRLRTAIKKTRAASGSEAGELLLTTVSLIDKAVNKGLIHRNTAARYKSRLTKRFAQVS